MDMATELKAAQTALLARYAPDARVRRVAWSQGETQVLELGSGPPLLLVHGGGACALVWAPILPSLARHHRVLAVDLPGHGLADPFDYTGVDLFDHARTLLDDILDAFELRAVDVVANSLGGLWSVVFAIGAPERVSRLVLPCAPPGAARPIPYQLRMLGLPVVGRLLLSNPTRAGSRRFWGQILVAHPERLDDTLLDADVAHLSRNIDSVLGLIRSIGGAGGLRRDLLLGQRWQALKAPTLLLSGERDAFLTPKVEKAWGVIAAGNPNLRVVTVPDAGHLPWLDAPDRVVDEIERFLSRQPRTEERVAP